MTNPFADAARGLADRLGQIATEKQAAKDAAEAERLAKERSFERATALFATVRDRVESCVRQANEAFGDTGISLATKVEPIQANFAGTIRVSMLGTPEKDPHFRIVGNASFRVFVHELKDPGYGPFDLTDAEKLPYEEMFNQFIRSVTETLESDAVDRKTG